jgi:hypothetical protein
MKASIEKRVVFTPFRLTVEIDSIEELAELLLRLNLPLAHLNITENEKWLPGAFDLLENKRRTSDLWEELEKHRAANGYLEWRK